MNDAIRAMLDRRRPATRFEYDRALREVLQETALAGLWRRGFFDKAAFYGGTALRLFYGLDRFSEDLDFSLLETSPDWKLAERLGGLKEEIEAFGFTVDINAKHEGGIESAFIKANTKIHLIRVQAPPDITESMAAGGVIKVKLETDTAPPEGIKTEIKTLLEPFPFPVRLVTPDCLFAGKVHACLCRSWKTRVKGRDWYDFLFFIARGIPVDMHNLESRMKQSGHWAGERPLTETDVRNLFSERINSINWKQAAEDVRPFVTDPRSLELWGPDLFNDITIRMRFEVAEN